MSYQSINPFNAKIFRTFAETTDEAMQFHIETAEVCYQNWRLVSFQARAEILMRAAAILRARVDEFAKPITLEMGKLIGQARAEVLISAEIIEYYARHAEAFLAPTKLTPALGSATVESSPIGVLFGVQPWNFPYYQLARFAAPNLMAGNVVIIKHASNVPQCALAFANLFVEAGLPEGAYTNVFATYPQIEQLIADPRIKGVALTGSVEAGKQIAECAGKNLKKSTMELGGSDAFIVLDDADLEATIKWAIWAKMNNTGQCCIAAKRFIVLDEIAEQFLSAFQAAMSALVPGDPMLDSTTLGPLASEAALEKLTKQVQDALSQGAVLELGGKRLDRPGYFMAPTILSGVLATNPAYRDEFFGPVALMFRVGSEHEAIALANDSDFGLGASVFGRDVVRATKVAQQIEAGMVFVNHPCWTAADLPFGGIKNSGYGRELGSLGIQEFVNKKLVRISPIDAPA